MRLLLILPASTYRAGEFLAAAEAIGAEAIVATNSNPLLALRYGDRFIDLDRCEPEELARRAIELGPIDGVLNPDDSMVEVATLIAQQLGVPANPLSAVGATKNKAALRRALSGSVPQPRFQVVEPGVDIAQYVTELGPPVVLKPLSLSGSQGVIRIDAPEDAPAVEQRIRKILAVRGHDPNQPLLMERFVPGPEVAVEGILTPDGLTVLAVFDKPDPLDGPYFEETIYVAPSRHHPEVVEEIHRVTSEACKALGLVVGPIHAELRIDRSTVVLIEIAARPIGGRCGSALSFESGIGQEELLTQAALGLPLDSAELSGSVGSLMIPIPSSGTLAAIDGVQEAREIPGITGIDIPVPLGETVQALPEGNRYLGFAYAHSPTPAETEAALRSVMATVVPHIRAHDLG